MSTGYRRHRVSALRLLAVVLALAMLALAPAADASSTPSAPRSVKTKAGNQQVTVSWRPPSSTGGSRVTRYRVVYWSAGSKKKKAEVGSKARKLVVTALTNGTRYSFRVYAHNKRGWGAGSKTRTAVPRTTPGAPVAIGATPDHGKMGLVWAAPTDNGGAAVGTYAVRWSTDHGTTWVPAVTTNGTDTVSGTSATVTGLGDGSPTNDGPSDFVYRYMFQVRAHNAAGWGPWAAAGYAPGVLEQAPPYVPGDSSGDAAAAAFRDLATGSYYSEGYPTAAGAGEWQDNGPMTFTIPPSCGSSTPIACPGGVPQDPPPTVAFDFTVHSGDQPRREVVNVTNAYRYDLTYRARVTTSAPIAITYSGVDCTFAVDSTAGLVPDLKLTTQVPWVSNPATTGGWRTGSPANTTITQLEGADYTLGGNALCTLGGAFIPASTLQDQLSGVVQDALYQALSDTCGAVSPWWWQPCYTILDPATP